MMDPEIQRHLDEFDERMKLGEKQVRAVGNLAQNVGIPAYVDMRMKLDELIESDIRLCKRIEELAEAQKRTEQSMRELAEFQKRTEESLRRFLDRAGNGHDS